MRKKGSYLLLGIYALLFGVVIIGSVIFEKKISMTGQAVGDVCIVLETPDYYTKDADDSICSNSTNFNEIYCDGATYISEDHYCPTGCLDGACKLCFDPDASATNAYLINSKVFGRSAETLQEISGNDSCVSNILTEYSCAVDGSLTSATYDCSLTGLTCSNGACQCVPVWTKTDTGCGVDDKNVTYWTDTNNCGGNIPEANVNTTAYCDHDSNNLIGTFSSMNVSGMSLTAHVNNSVGDPLKIFTGIQKVELKESGKTRVEFNWSFAQALNMYNVHIEKQPSTSSKGYLITNKLEIQKTIFVDKLSNSSNSVCVKDAEVESISDVSLTCDGIGEKIIPCPGTNSGISCSFSDGKYKISGIMHSAVVEFTDTNITSSCISNWTCSQWGICLNGLQERTCTDSKSCGTITGKPAENQTCVTECTEQWNCGNWAPVECPSDSKTQTRTCTDSNDCETEEKKPNESRVCTPKSNTNWLFILLIVFVVATIIGILILIMKMRSNIDGIVDGQGTPAQSSRPPFNPPSYPPVSPMPINTQPNRFQPWPPRLPQAIPRTNYPPRV
jgi:hypothetical protein